LSEVDRSRGFLPPPFFFFLPSSGHCQVSSRPFFDDSRELKCERPLPPPLLFFLLPAAVSYSGTPSSRGRSKRARDRERSRVSSFFPPFFFFFFFFSVSNRLDRPRARYLIEESSRDAASLLSLPFFFFFCASLQGGSASLQDRV